MQTGATCFAPDKGVVVIVAYVKPFIKIITTPLALAKDSHCVPVVVQVVVIGHRVGDSDFLNDLFCRSVEKIKSEGANSSSSGVRSLFEQRIPSFRRVDSQRQRFGTGSTVSVESTNRKKYG